MSNAASSKWREQYDRMKRWRARLNESGQADRRDNVYAFFVCCYHLTDWIKEDVSLNDDVREGVRSFVKSNRTLGLAADVTNGFKHLKRNREPEVDAVSVSAVGGFHVGRPEPALSGIVVAGDQTWEDAYVLADRCIEEWEGFLRTRGLM